ncbi:MAG: hypothetical protein AAF039_15775 [Bacteroidota bacterium]
MKKFKIVTMLFVLSIGSIFAQDQMKALKVDAPFRLFQGVVIKSDLRITTTILNQIEYGPTETNDTTSNERYSTTFFNFINQRGALRPAIVLDGFLVNDNSQRLNPIQFPTFNFFWRNRF